MWWEAQTSEIGQTRSPGKTQVEKTVVQRVFDDPASASSCGRLISNMPGGHGE